MKRYPNRRTEVLMDPYDVIMKPWISEKSTDLQTKGNVYVFEVRSAAAKMDIKSAVERIWDVHVVWVRTEIVIGKKKRMGRKSGFSADRKKAYVKLAKNDGIALLRQG
jgi:large subunit ribosomal protein L23